jgi:cation diffusion facilitator CzcD-associated flavoprotein CzcO
VTAVVIGAGPAGLASAAMLQRAGEPVIVLERSVVAAAWRGRYDRLHLHTVRWLSALPGYRIPRSFGKWPSRDRVVEYLERYARRHGLEVREGVEVQALEPGGTGWRLATSAGPYDAERVVVATGHSNVPFLPSWPGTFDGDVVHSSAYRNATPFRGKRVVVVGAGNSGAEIAVDLVEGGAAEVLLSVRTPPSIVRRDTLGFPSQVLGLATQHLPAPVVDWIARTIRRLAIPDLEPYGLPAPAHPYRDFQRRRTIPILDVGIVDAVRSERVKVVAPVASLDGPSVALEDGTRVGADVVVAATGFRTGLEPLVGGLGVLDEAGEPLVHGADEHPNAPGLHFVGYRIVLGGGLHTTGLDAKRLAKAVGRPHEVPAAAAAPV